MNNYDTVSKFISGNYSDSFSNSNHSLIVDDDTIYSYGTHFPIAKLNRETKTYVFNHNKFSRTTSNHQTMMKYALYKAGYTESQTLTYKQTGYHPSYYSIVSVQNEE